MQTGTLLLDLQSKELNCKLYIFKNSCPDHFEQIQELNWYYKIDYSDRKYLIDYKSELQYESSASIEELPIEEGTYYVFNSIDSFRNPKKLCITDGYISEYFVENKDNYSNAYYDALMDLIY
ncbi:MAG: hypothetical protein KBT21_06410 [Treponema sp.]|nr:hypothetical protein [Candidatus Treponema merdequi]